MPNTSLNFAPIVSNLVMQNYGLYQAVKTRSEDTGEEPYDLLNRIAGAILSTYEADEDFDAIFPTIADAVGPAATSHLFRQFVYLEKVNEWEADYLNEHPESANDELATLQPMQSPASRRHNV